MFYASDLLDLTQDRTYSSPVLVTTPLIETTKSTYYPSQLTAMDLQSRWLIEGKRWFARTRLNVLEGMHTFQYQDAIMGVNHYIDNLIQRYGLDNLQILEYDYAYYRRLDPGKAWAVPGNLKPNQPLLISMPFAGFGTVHPQMKEILDECERKQIPVHIDAAWLSAARGIDFDFAHPCIESVAFSLSKALGLWWNRIGIRYTKTFNAHDSISIYNRFHMIPNCLMDIGLHHINNIPADHLWDTHGTQYDQACAKLYLRPLCTVHTAMSMDRSKIYGMKKVLT